MALLDIKNRVEGDALIVELNGEIDKSTVVVVKQSLVPLIEQQSATVARFVLDCSHLTFINSEGIGTLMSLYASLAKREKKMILVGLQPNVRDVLDLIGVTKLIPNFPDLASVK